MVASNVELNSASNRDISSGGYQTKGTERGAKYLDFERILPVYPTDVYFWTILGFLIGVSYAEINFASNTNN